jgi:NAD(P)H-hydrate epimerase
MIDALFGAGLNRRLDPAVEQVLARGVAAQARTLAVDVPSGVDGTTGALHGDVPPADRTVTFFRLKPGHLLMPGRGRCGLTILADIGIPEQVLDDIAPKLFANRPELWQAHLPRLREEMHKYDRGHAVAVSGRMQPRRAIGRTRRRIGGARLRRLARRCSRRQHGPAYRHHGAAVRRQDGLPLLADRRLSSWQIGPSAGGGPETRQNVAAILATPAAAVLDADAQTRFAAGMQTELLGQIRGRGAPSSSPHAGEFCRLFGAGAGTGEDRDGTRPRPQRGYRRDEGLRHYRSSMAEPRSTTTPADTCDGRLRRCLAA